MINFRYGRCTSSGVGSICRVRRLPRSPSMHAMRDEALKPHVVRVFTENVEVYSSEVIWRKEPWRSLDAVESATLKWVDWYNNHRLLEHIGNIPPAEAEAAYFASLEEKAGAA